MNEALEKLPFWNELSNEEKSLCRMSAFTGEYKAGSYIFGKCQSQSCLGMIHILSGEIRASIVSEEGREITLFRIGTGEYCVLSAACVLSQITFETQLYVTKNTKVLVLPSETYSKLMDKNIHVRCFTYELATERFSSVMWVMQQMLFYGFDKRLANFFLEEHKRIGKNEIRMTQEEIATATNSAREVVTRMIKQFANDGLIESGRGVIYIKNLKGLQDIAQ